MENKCCLCNKVVLQGVLKCLWLISVTATCWSLLLARNEAVFNYILALMDSILFQTKLRALMWVRSVHNEFLVSKSS